MAYTTEDEELDEFGQPKKKPLQTVGSLAPDAMTTPLAQTAPATQLSPAPAPTAPNVNEAPTNTATAAPPPVNAPVPPPISPTPTMSTQDWINYTPMAGKTEAEKAEALEANAKLLNPNAATDFSQYQVANTPTGTVGANNVMQYTPNQTAIADLTKLAASDTTGAQQTAALGQYNAGNQAIDFAQANQDADADIAQRQKESGGPVQDSTAIREQILKASGFGTDGTFLGEPTNNPNATPGFPTNYDPNRPKLSQEQPTGPAEYIIGGQVYNNPEGTGSPLRAAPGTPTQNGSPGGSVATVGGPATSVYTPSMTTFDQTNNLRDKQINPNTANRGDIAQKYLDAFDLRAEPVLRDKLRSVGQRAASLGRIGMGDTAVEALNPYTDYLKERAALSNELAGRSADLQIGDEANARGEYRTERSYQDQLNRQAIEDAIRQYQLGEQSKNAEFGRNATTTGLLLNAANTNGANAGIDFAGLASLLAPFLTKSK